ncbi:MAG: hypothetical protein J5580_02225 [Clostridia bacterium]|nr:hypothetical protein [Clostridia bacterium]
MKFIKTAFSKIRDYFTANQGRKIFFWGIIASVLIFTIYFVTQISVFRVLGIVAILMMGMGTLWDSMYSRYLFLKKIRDIQYEHLKEIADKQAAGENVVITATFSDEEKSYLRRRKWWFILMILFKVILVIALFSLLLAI